VVNFSPFSGLRMESQLHCSLVSVSNKTESDEFRKPKVTVSPMSRELNWNPLDCYSESLHSCEVINARELKFCEGCGVVLVRLRGSMAQFCPGCKPLVPIAFGRMQ
jgi:hypothetical protein